MIFKDRQEAGEKLLDQLQRDLNIAKNIRQVIVISLLRGGAILGHKIANGLKVRHLPLAVAKIPAPHNPELAIGALCFDIPYLEKEVINSLNLTKGEITGQIEKARDKFNSYLTRFAINESEYAKNIKNKMVILTDDGIATGSTIKAAILYLKTLLVKSIILAVPVAPINFSTLGVDEEIVLHKNHTFGAVSQYYQNFPQIEDDQVKQILTTDFIQ